MPVYFIVVGCFALIIMFFFDCKKLKNLTLFVALIALLVGFFVGEIRLKNVSINIPFLIGAVQLCVGFILSNPHRRVWRALVCSLGFTLLYLSINLISVGFNVFFDVVPICIVGLVSGIIAGGSGMLIATVTLMLCEIVNAFVMIEHLGFWALYSQDFVFCIVLVLSGVFVIKTLKHCVLKMASKRKSRV